MGLVSGTRGCMYNCGDECTGECLKEKERTENTTGEWLLPRAFKKESGEYIPNGYDTYIKENNNIKQYILINSEKVAKIKHEALQKIAAHSGEPLSEASIEARAVLDVVNYLYENNQFGWWEEDDKSPEVVAYETGWKDGYDEGMYDRDYK